MRPPSFAALAPLVALAMACRSSDEQGPNPEPPPSCATGLVLPDGTCLSTGVPIDACAPGFVHDGDAGCAAVLPPEECPEGLMAVPGDEACRPVMPCGEGTWGDLPTDATTEFVDGAYAGADSDGSMARPWTTIMAGVSAAPAGAMVAVAAGTYAERIELDEPVQIWGVCPERVFVDGTTIPMAFCPPSALCVTGGADGSVVGGISLRGPVGVILAGPQNVVLDRVRIHDSPLRGMQVQRAPESASEPSGLTLRDSLVERNAVFGLLVSGSTLVVERSVVRETQPAGEGDNGVGIAATLSCEDLPAGIVCANEERGDLLVTQSVISANHEAGIDGRGSEVRLEGSVVRNTLPRADGTVGRGLALGPACIEGVGCDPATRVTTTVTTSVVSGNHDVGILVQASDLTVERSIVRDTKPRASDASNGDGIVVQLACEDIALCSPELRSSLAIGRSVIERNHSTGVSVISSEVAIEQTVIRDTRPRADGLVGRGLLMQVSCGFGGDVGNCISGLRASGTLQTSVVSGNAESGVAIIDADLAIASSAITRTTSRADGRLGDGVTVVLLEQGASLALSNARIADNVRAGVAAFGAAVSLAKNDILCNAFPLLEEAWNGADAMFIDQGGNGCGCDAAEECKAVSANLEPPSPVASP